MNYVLDAVDFGLLVIDAEGRVESANRWVRDRCPPGLPRAGQPLAAAFDELVEPRLAQAVSNCLQFGNSSRLSQAFHPMPLPLRRPGDAESQRMRQAVDVIAVQPPGQAPRQCLVQVRDVSEIVRREHTLKSQARQLGTELSRVTDAHREIERQSARFREMARLAPVGLFETDPQGRLVYANARTAELLSIEPQGLMGEPWERLFNCRALDLGALQQRWQASATAGVRFGMEVSIDGGAGTAAWMRIEASALRDSADQLQGHIFTLVDVTELHEQARRSELRASHDVLTGLANRERFNTRLADVLKLATLSPPQAAVLFVDLDRFKSINDLYGHQAGDLVLKAVASRIRRSVRAEDLVARLGGDEFAVLLQDVQDEAAALRIALKIEKTVGLPIHLGSGHVRVGASVGCALVPTGGCEMEALLQRADSDMYRVKRDRSGRQQPAPPLPVSV